MFGRNFYLALWIAVAVQVIEVHSTVAALTSICNKAKKCYVDTTSSKVCNRMEKKCNQCVTEKENDSVLSALTRIEYMCLDVDDNGDCPTGTTKCPAKLKTSDDEELTPEENKRSSYITDSDESSPTFTSTEKKLISSSWESKPPIRSASSSTKVTPTIENNSTEKPTSLLSSTNSSSNSLTFETPKKSTSKKMATSVAKSSTPLASEDKVHEDALASDSSTLHDVALASEEINSSSPDSADTNEAQVDENNPDQSNISSAVTPTATTPEVSNSTTKDTILSNKSDSATTAIIDSESDDSKLGLILCICLGAAAVVGFAGFVVWKMKATDEDSDDKDGPSKPVMSRNVVSLPSATSVSTAYLSQPNQYGNNNYEHPYSNNYGNNYGDDNGYSNNHAMARYVTGSTPGAAAGMDPACYGSPCSIDNDCNYDTRRTDSILGGTGVMLSTKSGMQFSAGPSPTYSDTNQDIWGNEVGSVHQKCMASSASVEF